MINLINGDCYQEIKKIPDKSVDLVYIDVPYQITGGGAGKGSSIAERIGKIYYTDIADIRNGFDYAILDELCRVLKHIYIYIYGVAKTSCLT